MASSSRPSRCRLAALVVGALGVGVAAPAGAELVVLANGAVMRVDGYELRGDRLRFGLRSGGFVTLEVERVERIVDDEIEPEPIAVAGVPETSFSLAFAEGQVAPETPFGDLLLETSRRHALNPMLLAAIARAESAWDSSALSHKGARGLMQVMPATAERFGVSSSDLWDPARNVEAGARYLRFLVDRFEGDLTRVLAAYNAGEGAVDRHGGVPPYRETRGYVAKVLAFLDLASAPTS
ncbi:MAG TPA: lytic transglycosylase domain-containing protein [Thermoanaerobaculia bacterium]|nr:lytic transglycosylase domain-containing protein [Thermoanaerobaculia bacterium]